MAGKMCRSTASLGWLLSAIAAFNSVSCDRTRGDVLQPPTELVDVYAEFPAWSPNGDLIALYYKGDGSIPTGVWLLSLSSGNARFLSGGDQPSWSPNGTKLAMSRNAHIVVVTLDSGESSELTWSGRSFGTSWSPDGALLAYDRIDPADSSGIWIMKADGSEKRLASPDSLRARSPSWSPDGEWIACSAYASSETPHLHLMRIDGSEVRRVGNTPSGEYYPRWSPDGAYIAVTTHDGIRLFHVDSGEWRHLSATFQERLESRQTCSWSPDATELVYNREYLWAIHRDGTENRVLPWQHE
jgi:Tol biopolymer transport system component